MGRLALSLSFLRDQAVHGGGSTHGSQLYVALDVFHCAVSIISLINLSPNAGPTRIPIKLGPFAGGAECRAVHSMPRARGRNKLSSGQYVTNTRKASMVISQGSTATVSSVMPIFVMPLAT